MIRLAFASITVKMRIIGITGPIGAGKTYIISLMSKRVRAYINTDNVYHTLISEPSECTENICRYFGDSVRAQNGGIDRKALGEIVFHSEDKLKKLNEITHVCVGKRVKEILSELEAKGEKAVLIEVPMMFESGFDKMCDVVVCVTADREVRLERIIQRSGLSREDAEIRMDNQKSAEFYMENSDYTVYNNGTEDLITQVNTILEKILITND